MRKFLFSWVLMVGILLAVAAGVVFVINFAYAVGALILERIDGMETFVRVLVSIVGGGALLAAYFVIEEM